MVVTTPPSLIGLRDEGPTILTTRITLHHALPQAAPRGLSEPTHPAAAGCPGAHATTDSRAGLAEPDSEATGQCCQVERKSVWNPLQNQQEAKEPAWGGR